MSRLRPDCRSLAERDDMMPIYASRHLMMPIDARCLCRLMTRRYFCRLMMLIMPRRLTPLRLSPSKTAIIEYIVEVLH